MSRTIAIERAKSLFGVEHVNVQPYSGSPANLAVYFAFVQPGGHDHGDGAPDGRAPHARSAADALREVAPPSDSTAVRKDTGRVDMDQVADLARRERPKIIVCGGTAIPRTIDFPAFAQIASDVGALLLADIAHIAGLVAGGVHPSPVGHAPVITTTTHKTLRGPRGAMILCTEEHGKKIDSAILPGLQGGPHNHTTAAIAVALKEAATPEFRSYAADVVANAKVLADELLGAGFDLVSGGTDNHLI
jgi:glycine hydroxymethyltransferase